MSCTRFVSMRRLLRFTMVAIAASACLVVAQVRQASASAAMTQSYELVGADGGVFTGAGATYSGSLGGQHIAHPIVAVLGASANDTMLGSGYLLVDSAGIVHPFGLSSFGDLRDVHLNAPIVGAVSVPGVAPYRGGYVMVAADGGVFAFGGARFPGSLAPFHLRVPIVGIQAAFLPRRRWCVARRPCRISARRRGGSCVHARRGEVRRRPRGDAACGARRRHRLGLRGLLARDRRREGLCVRVRFMAR